MRVLFDIVHPADVLFFKRPIDTLRARGDEILICSRRKDIACDLLDRFGLAHFPISAAADGKAGAAAELLRRDMAMIAKARDFRPHVMVGFGGVSIAHCTAVTGLPSISFYDSEGATLQTRLTWPFISRLFVPERYAAGTPQGRTRRLKGTKELSYLHPGAFAPDRDIALANGLDPGKPNRFIRIVSWRANHDWGKSGWSSEDLHAVVARLSQDAVVHISSEIELPEALRPHAYRGAPDQMHHLLGLCDLYVGESATMAAEAAVLGVRSIFAGRDHLGYIEDLTLAGVMTSLPLLRPDATLTEEIDAALARSAQEVRAARDAYVAQCPDWAEEVVKAIDAYAPAENRRAEKPAA